jgi:uncharacterized membrane protein YeaQ/YmgE (transglycosylase-associated protein family)
MVVGAFLAGLLALIVMAVFVTLALYIIVPLLVGKGANAVGRRFTGQSLNLGCLGSLLVAIGGAVVGHYLFGSWGPEIPSHGLHIIPAFLGSVVVVVILQLISINRPRRY